MIIKDDLQAIYLDDPRKILIRDEEIKAYNVLNLQDDTKTWARKLVFANDLKSITPVLQLKTG